MLFFHPMGTLNLMVPWCVLTKKNGYKLCNPASRLFNYKVHLKSKRRQYIGSWVENGCNFENISQKFKSVIYMIEK